MSHITSIEKKMSASYEHEQFKDAIKDDKLKGVLESIKVTSREKNQRVIEAAFGGPGE